MFITRPRGFKENIKSVNPRQRFDSLIDNDNTTRIKSYYIIIKAHITLKRPPGNHCNIRV